jgi:TP901 family phage tail tape measure protein
MARPIEVPVVVKKGSLSRSIEGEATTAMRRLGGSSTAVQPLGRMLGKIRADADEFTKSIEASNARVIAFGASVGVINGISNAFKSLVTTTIKVEKSMADINVVLGASQKNLAKFGDGLFKVAKNTAQSFEAVSEAALEFSRQGLTMEETLKRTNDALILTRLTGLKAADSVKGLTAAVNGFGKAGLTTTQIINKLSAVDTKFAVGTDDLINALGRAGAVAQDAGVNFDELVALVTVAQQKTARGGAVIGNAFKTIYTRMQDPKALQALRQVGVAVDDVRGAALPANRVLQNLAQTYDTLNRSQKATLDQFVAGKFQINILKSVLGDLNTVNGEYARAQQVSINATDQAIQKNDTLNKTMAALATQSGLALDELAKKVGDLSLGPGMRNILQSFNALVEGATKGLDGEGTGSTFAKGLLRGIGGVLTGPGLFIIGGVFIKLFKDLTVFGVKSLKNLLGLNNASKQQAALQQGIGQLLSTNLKFQQAIAAAEGNVAKQAAITQRFLASEVVLRERAAAASAKLAASAYAGGFGVSAAGMVTRGRSRGRAPSFAPTGGKVPNFAASAGMRQYIEGSTFNAGALPDIVVGGTPTGRSSATVDQFFKGSKLIKANSLTKAAQIGREGFTKTGWRLFHEFGLHKRFGGPVARSPFPGMSGAHPPIASIIGSTNEILPFSGAKDARKFYREAFSAGPAREAGITRDGLRLMGKGRGFEQDPIGAFKQAIKNSGMSQAAAAKMRQPYFEGGLESAIFKRNSALKEHSGKNFIFDMARDTGGGRYRMMDVKNTLSSENYSNLVTKKMRALNLPGFEESHYAQEKMFHKEADKLGTQQRKARKLLRFRGVPMSQVFQRYIQSFAPNFSPLSDAVQREKMQVGSMMGISPSSVQTRVVQNSSLQSPFNPQGFGVISPTVGQNSFADAARMHRGEDLRTTNLPNFAEKPLKLRSRTGSDFDWRAREIERTASGYSARKLEVTIADMKERAAKKFAEPVKSLERTVKMSPGSASFGAHRRVPYVPPDPPTFKERIKRSRMGQGIAAGASMLGTGAGAAMGPAFTAMMGYELASGFVPPPTAAERYKMSPQQRISAGRGPGALKGAALAGGIGGGLAAAAVGSGLVAAGGTLSATGAGALVGIPLALIGAGIGYGMGGEAGLTTQEREGGIGMMREGMGADTSAVQSVQSSLQAFYSAKPGSPERKAAIKSAEVQAKEIQTPKLKRRVLAEVMKAKSNAGVAGSSITNLTNIAMGARQSMGREIGTERTRIGLQTMLETPGDFGKLEREALVGGMVSAGPKTQQTLSKLGGILGSESARRSSYAGAVQGVRDRNPITAQQEIDAFSDAGGVPLSVVEGGAGEIRKLTETFEKETKRRTTALTKAFNQLGFEQGKASELAKEFFDGGTSNREELLKILEDAKKGATKQQVAAATAAQAQIKEANAYQEFLKIRRGFTARSREAQTNAKTFGVEEQTIGLGTSQALSIRERIGGRRSTIGMSARFAREAQGRQVVSDREQMFAEAGVKLPAIAEVPGANLSLIKDIEAALQGGDVGAIARITKQAKSGTYNGVNAAGDPIQMSSEDLEKLSEWSKNLTANSDLIDILNTKNLDYIKTQEDLAKTLDKNGVLIAGIEGFRNSLQDAFMSIADPSLSGGDIARNFAMGILGSIQQQASSNVADFVSGSLFGDLFKKKDKQSGGIISAQNGMYISGGRSGDKNPAMLEDGEYVLNRNAVKMMGGGRAIDAINFGMAPRFAGGGVFSGVPSKHRQKALDKFGYSSFGPSTGGSTLGGGGMSMGLDYFDPRLSSLAHANDPTLQAMRGIFREEKQKDIAEKFQKQANKDALVQGIVGAAVSTGLSYGVGKLGTMIKDSKLRNQALADESEVFGGDFDFSPLHTGGTRPQMRRGFSPNYGGGTGGGGPSFTNSVVQPGIPSSFPGDPRAGTKPSFSSSWNKIKAGGSAIFEAIGGDRLSSLGSGIGAALGNMAGDKDRINAANVAAGNAAATAEIARTQAKQAQDIVKQKEYTERDIKLRNAYMSAASNLEKVNEQGKKMGFTKAMRPLGGYSSGQESHLGESAAGASGHPSEGLMERFRKETGIKGKHTRRQLADYLYKMSEQYGGGRPAPPPPKTTVGASDWLSTDFGPAQKGSISADPTRRGTYLEPNDGKAAFSVIKQQFPDPEFPGAQTQQTEDGRWWRIMPNGKRTLRQAPKGYQRGGSIDNIPAMLTGGEFVVNAGAVKKYGSNTLNNMNRFQTGGMVGSQKFVPGEESSSKKQAISEPSTNNNTVNISINPGGGASVNANEDFSGTSTNSANQNRELGRKIKNAVLEVIQTEKRIGGSLRNPYAKEQ